MFEPLAYQVLLVEDNEDDVLLLRQAFRKAGFRGQLGIARDGAEAFAYLRGDGGFADRTRPPWPDVVPLDLNMPRMNGHEVLQTVRAEPAWDDLRILVLSASNLPADASRARAPGADGYVLKPNRLDDLVKFAGALHLWLETSSGACARAKEGPDALSAYLV